MNTDQAINGVEGVIEFPTDKLEVVSINKSRSIMSLWVQEPSFSNAGQVGIIQFAAIKLNPGYVGSKGNVIDIIFRVKDIGVANVSFASGAILANDGHGNNLLTSFGSAIFTLIRGTTTVLPKPPVQPSLPTTTIQPPTKPLPPMPQVKYFIQDKAGKDVLYNMSEAEPKWSSFPYAKMTWTIPSDVTGVSTLFDDNPNSEPSATSSALTDNLVLPFLTEGRHYFHIRFINDAGAGQTVHLPLLIDLREPKYFSIEFTDTESNSRGIFSTSAPRPRTMFYTEDEMSGLNRYEYKINAGDWTMLDLERDGTFILPKLTPETRHDLMVRAYDNAGNFIDAAASINIQPIISPAITFYPRNIETSEGSPLVIDGRSAPGATVEVILTLTEPITISAKADDDGSWRVVYSQKLPAGLYSMRARQILDNGAESSFSEPVTIRINLWSGKILQWLKTFNWYIILILFFIFSELGTLFFYRRAVKKMRQHFEQNHKTNIDAINQK
ncbi:MAG: hypothetical protein A2301_00740 [Candidatus Magasanikbacteria bacterium RIFOXYB2_FULL_40_13]|uniref:Bacterial Ig-like domain-containing protein n=2 Tax=Candidatus Magasanikiibacteriota TaxID=1752731 RepID=A0A1F6NK60_9BACT|nr:MAG: hypothetical protein A2373_00560 [Candidatus Magasanikbacteria bacterium RIFOXYB1_FULL_40_15]OGH86890.1 MAG: hypothetical protein A2301_00740 [Candidatus Magasanikbacteria bacterium RIFOXYB2_FULL_40_13]OGH87681.1 MAG: hypothetical protein A2206_01945 [Candidatus Magasanikbacteria bacterium RIFOXYA1_FULL_40_8]